MRDDGAAKDEHEHALAAPDGTTITASGVACEDCWREVIWRWVNVKRGTSFQDYRTTTSICFESCWVGWKEKKNSSRKSDFLRKIPSWFYDISIFHENEKKTLYIPTNPSKTLQRKKWPKNGQKWPKNSFLFVDVQRGMPNSSKKDFQKMPKICNMYVSRVPIMSTNTYTITLDILTKPCAHLKRLIKKDSLTNF